MFELLDKQDEIFLYRFSNYPTLLQGWTSDRQLLTRAIGRISANGGTAMYDTDRRGDSAGAAGTESQEGAPAHFGRQRHGQQHRDTAPSSS